MLKSAAYPYNTINGKDFFVENFGLRFHFNGKENDNDVKGEGNSFDFEARMYDPRIGHFIGVDPLTHQTPQWSPYAAFNDNPLYFTDPSGMSANPIYDTDGSFMGTDDDGIQGDAIVMDKKDFTQGMKHEDAVKKDIGRMALITPEAKQKFSNHYFELPSRPDYDGFVTIDEGVDWAKSHPNLDNDNKEDNGLGNATPNDYLYLDAAKMNFGNVKTTDLNLNTNTGINLLYKTNMSSSISRATTYALGSTILKLTDMKGTIEVINGHHNIYNWDYGGGIIRKTLIGGDRILKDLNDSHGFPLYIYGTGKLNSPASPSGVKFNAY